MPKSQKVQDKWTALSN
uniref:Uncharacterized protein n=1 Tax=Arundo donax TaxID=35708 RepID=A0A0A8Y539_ARUDO